MKGTTNVTTYLQRYGPALAGRIADRFKPLVTAPQLDVRRELGKLKREPFPAQAGVIEGLVALFRSGRRHGFIVAECGTGKTIMSMAVPYVLAGGKPHRALVMAPGHLLQKWAREIEETIPNAAVTITGHHDVAERVSDLLDREGIESVVLSVKIKPNDREAWLREKVKDAAKVLISQVRLIETGLDLIEFPTLVFHQISLLTFTLRQASRRAWRIGQSEPVRVFYMAYEGTLQSRLLSLMASKITASSALEGSFSEDGLAALAGGEDLTTELARTLAENIRLEDAGRAWAKVNARKPKAAAKPEAEPRIDPFRQAASPRRTVRKKRSRRAARVVAVPAFG